MEARHGAITMYEKKGPQGDYLDRYESVHADRYQAERVENMDEDDVSDPGEDNRFGTFLMEHQA
jgi:hypothetical protein